MRAVGVVVPVHDEEALLGACLDAIAVAVSHLGLPVHVVPVLDSCTDRSALIAGPAVEVSARNVGIARAAGFTEVLRLAGGDPAEVWIATTDADSVVPSDWLTVQRELWDEADAVTGTVEVADWSEHGSHVSVRFGQTYGVPLDGHPHMHGANLAVRGSAYLSVGGFAAVTVGEDQALVAALRQAGHRVVATGRIPVSTSARSSSRTTGGFADHLVGLGTGS